MSSDLYLSGIQSKIIKESNENPKVSSSSSSSSEDEKLEALASAVASKNPEPKPEIEDAGSDKLEIDTTKLQKTEHIP